MLNSGGSDKWGAQELLNCAQRATDNHGVVGLQSSDGIMNAAFSELLNFYLTSTFISLEGDPFINKTGPASGHA